MHGNLPFKAVALLLFCQSLAIATAGEFFNLDFELARVPPDSSHFVPIRADEALPGWNVLWSNMGYELDAAGNAMVVHNGIYLSGDTIALIDTHFESWTGLDWVSVLANSYSVALHSPIGRAEIWQTGSVPEDARWLQFQTGSGTDPRDFSVLMGDQELSILSRGGGLFEANVTRFAGSETTLRFLTTSPDLTWDREPPGHLTAARVVLDNIRFVIPEPVATAWIGPTFVVLGVLVFRSRARPARA